MLGVFVLVLTAAYGMLLLSGSSETAQTVGIGYVIVIATISLTLDVLGGR